MADRDIIETGRDDAGRFVSKQMIQAAAQREIAAQGKETDKAKAKVDALTGAWARQEKHLKNLFSTVKKQTSAQISDFVKLQKAMEKSYAQQVKVAEKAAAAETKAVSKAMQSQVREYRRLANEKIKAIRAGRSGGGGDGWSLGSLGLGSIITTAALYGAVRKFFSAAAPLLDAEINRRGTVALLRGNLAPNVKASSVAQLISQYQGLGAAQLFGPSANVRGMMRLQSELARGAGTERATSMVMDLLKTYGDSTDRQSAFLQALAGGGDVGAVLKSFASGQNIQETTRALNALSIAGDQAKGALDPMVSAELRLTQTADKLDATLEKLIQELTVKLLPALEKVTGWLSGLSTGQLAGLGVGALLAPTLLRGGAKLAGRGIGALIGGGGAAGAGGAVAGGGALATTGILAGAVAVGTAGALAIDKYRDRQGTGAIGWYLRARAADDAQVEQSRQMEAEARQRAATAKTEIDRLRREREAVVGQIGQIPHAFGGGYSDENKDKLQLLQIRWSLLTRKINEETEKAKPKQRSFWQSIADGARSAWGEMGRFSGKLPELARDLNFRQQQEKAARLGQSKLTAEVAGSETELARARFQNASTSIFGPEWGRMSAIPEYQALQQSLDKEIGRLTTVLGNIDKNTEQGQIESNKLNTQILGLRQEQKSLQIQMLQGMSRGYLDAITAQSFGAGRFERIIITQQNNLRRGMADEMVRANPLLGQAGPLGAGVSMPFTFTPDMAQTLQDFARWAKETQRYFGNVLPQPMVPIAPQVVDAQASGATGATATASKPVNRTGSTSDWQDKVIRGARLIEDGMRESKERERPVRSVSSMTVVNP